jgi:hypothetical protein
VVAVTVKLLRTASIVICLIVIGSFLLFALDQTKSASAAQQAELRVGTASSATQSSASKPPAKHENGVHEALDEASSTLTSPFSGIVSGADGEWATRGVRLFLALLVYGFGLGYLARALRVRV